MERKEDHPTLLMVTVLRYLRRPGLLFGLVLGVGFLVLLLAFLLGSGTSTSQAAPSMPRRILPRPAPETCDEPGNLAPNPGFECEGASPNEPADWTCETYEGSPVAFSRSRQSRHSGDYSVFIGSGSTGSRSRWRSKPVPAREGRIYEFSVWVNADQLSDEATVSLTFWSGWPSTDTILGIVDAVGVGDTDGKWVHLMSSHMAPPGTRYIRLECRLYGAGSAWFDDASIRESIEEPVLDLAQFDAPDPVRPGESLVYTLVYSNTGSSTASNVVITDTFDANVHFIGDANPLPVGGAGQVWFWRLSSLPVDGPHQIVITTTVEFPLPDRSVLLNRVEWRSDQTSARWDLEETLVRSVPVLTIDKTDMPDPVTAGERLTYTIAYTNSGTAPTTGISLVEYYPPHTTFITATPAPDNPPVNVLWQMPGLVPGGTQSVTIVLSTSASAAGTVFNNVLFDSHETGPVFAYEPTTIIGPPLFAFSMSLSPEGLDIPAEAGRPITAWYQLVNTGHQTLTHIIVTTGTLQNWRGRVQIEPGYVDSLAAGDYRMLTLTVQPATDEISGVYPVEITATSSETSTHTTARVLIARRVGVLVGPDYVRNAQPCDQVTFTHWITNMGNFTDTIVVNVSPSVSWLVSPTSAMCLDVGIGEACPFTVTVGVPCTAQVGDVGSFMVLAASTTGPVSERALDFIVVVPPTRQVFLPVVMKQFGGACCLPCDGGLCNGDFEEPLEPYWTVQSPPVERRCVSGNCFARLGTEADNALCNGDIPPHTATLAQTFAPTATGVLTLSFGYKVHTLDVLMPSYDTLGAYIDATQVFTLTHQHEHYGCGDDHPLIVSGTVEIPVFVTHGVPTTLKFSLVNDRWFNTYADIDNVRVTYAR